MTHRVALALTLALAIPAYAQKPAPRISDGVVKIGLLLDMNSLYADLTGEGSVTGARMASAVFPRPANKSSICFFSLAVRVSRNFARMRVCLRSRARRRPPDAGSAPSAPRPPCCTTPVCSRENATPRTPPSQRS